MARDVVNIVVATFTMWFFIWQVSAYEGEVRLRGGTSKFEGRVEIFHNGVWGTVCDTDWGMNEATVVCNQLGYPLATDADRSLAFGPGNGTIWMDDVDCDGDEFNLNDCEAKWADDEGVSCSSHNSDAGVICSPIEDGAIRLFGSSSRFEGGVEFYYRGKWGTVCDDSWSGNDAKVACRQLGYPKAKYAITNARQYYGSPRYPYNLEDLGCDGYEDYLINCWPIDFTPENCDYYDLAGVVCYESVEDNGNLSAEAIAGIVVASIFALLVLLCCCAALCSSQKRKRPTVSRDRNLGRQAHINAVYNASSDTATLGGLPPPPGPGVNTVPFTPPAGYVPGYRPPGADAPPAYETLDTNYYMQPTNPQQSPATTNPAYPPPLPSMATHSEPPAPAPIDPAYPPPLPSMATQPEQPPSPPTIQPAPPLPSMATHPAVESNTVYEQNGQGPN